MRRSLCKLLVVFGVFVSPASLFASELAPLADAELGVITGQEGVALGLELYWNAEKNSDPALDGRPLPALNCAAILSPCRTATQIEGRESNGSRVGEWLVYKDAYFALRIRTLNVDLGFMRNAASAVAPGNFDDQAYISPAKFSRFYDPSVASNTESSCLLPANLCTATTIGGSGGAGGMPAMKLFYPTPATSYTPGSNISTGYNSLELGWRVGKMFVEYDTSAACASDACRGFNQDSGKSFAGVHIKDVNSHFAGMAIEGSAYVYGF